MCWWGIWILCLSPTTDGHLPSSSRSAQYGAIMSPIFTTLYEAACDHRDAFDLKLFRLLMFGSGIPTAEKPTAKKFFLLSHASDPEGPFFNAWTNYKAYLENTSILIPIPPSLYLPLPTVIKKTILMDFPLYQFNEAIDGVAAVEASK